ncbi:Mu transposase C-terminal domain-containing protein [Alicyclobacillus dauci]|uniref:Mu transposase C-terminal domain-containing protein n=1 Tax=Alicyclobacillus dauci TaxID=1475485 RepID=A0ABY6Z0T8_9BACL|nr:Mu transposase C-terminal domain-containing protein [Alicyclobacillus dauci]WAH36484.1 Mu transposase C-terminal domain-containing protein [Alicyclobacillus dauci]
MPELVSQLETFLLTYNLQPHSETGVPPQERWEGGGFLPRLPESRTELDLLLLQVVKTRRVHSDGIHFLNHRYMDTTLAAYVGEEVVIRYDPRDIAEIRVFHKERFLCNAICAELSGQQIGIKEITRARNQRRKTLSAILRDRASSVESFSPPKAPQSSVNESKPIGTQPKETVTLKRYRNE